MQLTNKLVLCPLSFVFAECITPLRQAVYLFKLLVTTITKYKAGWNQQTRGVLLLSMTMKVTSVTVSY